MQTQNHLEKIHSLHHRIPQVEAPLRMSLRSNPAGMRGGCPPRAQRQPQDRHTAPGDSAKTAIQNDDGIKILKNSFKELKNMKRHLKEPNKT